MRLRAGLGRARNDVTWVNIWQDEEAAGFVRTYRDGFETVPTVVTGDGRMIQATPQPVKDFLAER